MSDQKKLARKSPASTPVDANGHTVKPEIVVNVFFGVALPISTIDAAIKAQAANGITIDYRQLKEIDGYPVVQDFRVRRNNCKDKRYFVAMPPVFNPWCLRENAKHDGVYYPPRMWPDQIKRKAFETALRRHFLWNSDVENNFGVHVAVQEGRV